MENTLKSILFVLHKFIILDEEQDDMEVWIVDTNYESTIKDLERLFFNTIEEACNVRCPEDIENFIDGFDEEFHSLFSKVGKQLKWSFNGI